MSAEWGNGKSRSERTEEEEVGRAAIIRFMGLDDESRFRDLPMRCLTVIEQQFRLARDAVA